jgi:MFS family permease
MRLPPFEPPQRRRQSEQLRESLGYIVHEPIVRTLLLIAGSISLFGLVYFPLLPAFARDVLQTDASGFGLLSASSGAGALVAALTLAHFSDRIPRGRLLTGALLLFPLFLVGLTLMRTLLPAMLMIALVGWSGVTSLALTNTLIQSMVPDTLRARVMSVFTMQLMGLGPIGALVAGVVAQWIGSVPLVMACCAAIAWLIVLGNIVLVPRLRQL